MFDPETAIIWLFVVAFISDFARIAFELAVNFRFKRRARPTISLNGTRAAFVIPCHDSADTIESTVDSLPEGYVVYCVANNCTDDTVAVVEGIQKWRCGVRLIDVDYPEKSKTKAVLLGVLEASRAGFSHFVLLDDDVIWPAGRPIAVMDESVAVTAVPLMPIRQSRPLHRLQLFEYMGTNLNKRCQAWFGGNVTWASGAAAIYRCDVFLEVMRLHDGEFAGEDIQCSYLHHYFAHRIDFLPQTIVATEVPGTFSEWWRQRAHCWDVSFMFLHIDLLLRVLFRRSGAGPGWWIRLMTFYRIYDAVLVVAKIGLPVAIIVVPWLFFLWFATSYVFLTLQCLSYPFFYPSVTRGWHAMTYVRMSAVFLVFPIYQFMTLASRFTALPRAMRLKLRRRTFLGEFIDKNYAFCNRVNLTLLDGTPPQ